MPRRRSPFRLLAIMGLCLGVLFSLRLPAARAASFGVASVDEEALTLPLVPVGGPGFIEINAFTLRASLACPEGRCRLEVAQRYQFHNRDRVQSAPLALTLGSSADAARAQHRLLAADGTVMEPSSDAAGHVLWRLTLAPDEMRAVQVASQHDLDARAFIRWRWEMAALAAWGQIISARVSLHLPQQITDDAFYSVSPPPAGFDGREMVWEYEALASPTEIAVTLMAPPHWERLRALTVAQDHYPLALHHLALYEAAQQIGLAYPDPFEVVVAALLAVPAHASDFAAARSLLADLYLQRADQHEDLRLNYTVLAARQLEALRAQAPPEETLVQRLRSVYLDAANAASGQGDPAGALAYLHKASNLPGGNDPAQQAALELLTLRWAVDLALGGQVVRAMAELEGAMSPQVREELFHYAPPIVSARTAVELAPGQRVVQYRLQMYQPTQAVALARLQALVARLEDAVACQAQMEAGASPAVTLTVRLDYGSLAELQQASAVIVQSLPQDDFLAALLTAPWRGSIAQYEAQQRAFTSDWRYAEQVDLQPLAAARQARSQYVHWRMVELRNQRPSDDIGALENQLALLALREQAQVWDGLPSASYWTYRVAAPAGADPSAAAQAPAIWLIPWGETTRLAVARRAILWPSVWAVVAGVALALSGALGLLALARRRRRHT